MTKTLILDETEAKSIKWIAIKWNIPYFTDIESLNKYLRKMREGYHD
jgi:hypothetical protein